MILDVTSNRGRFLILLATLIVPAMARGDEPKASESPLVKLLKGGRVPEGRQGTIVEMIGRRGSAADLGFLYERATRPDGFPTAIRLKAFEALTSAAQTRKAMPDADPAALITMIGDPKTDPTLRIAAIRFASVWKLAKLGDALGAVARDDRASLPLRAAALDALAALGGGGRPTIETLTATDQPRTLRTLAVGALAAIDVEAAAEKAAGLLGDAAEGQDLAPLLTAFLNRQGGSDVLARAIASRKLPADPAKRALRAIYALGHADAPLVAELSKAAGLDAEVKPLAKPELDRLIAEVLTRGDPERGEAVFRRADLNCKNCHALAGAGGGIGPELSAVGTSSPPDYIVNSVMFPDQAIKEQFETLVVLTDDGHIYQGIVADKDDNRVVLKDASGEPRTIATSEIEDQKRGGSLMPKGLVNLMTHAEFVDLVRFLCELGKPGPFAIRPTPTIQRWRVLKPVPADLDGAIPDAETFAAQILGASEDRWLPVYARVSGTLPLVEPSVIAGGAIVYIQGEIDISTAGPIAFRLDSADGVHAWLDDRAATIQGGRINADLTVGRHKLTLRIDTGARKEPGLKVEVVKAEGSAAEFAIVGGK